MSALALVLVTVDAAAALGQDRTRMLKGTVLDSAEHKPVSQAAVYIGRTTMGQRTGNDGTFRVSATVGPHALIVRRPGYIPLLITIPADTVAPETDLGSLSLHQVKTDADQAAVQEADMRMYPELVQFYDRKAQYHQGLFLTPDDLQRVGGSLFALIRQKPNFHFICFVTRRGDVDCGQQLNRGPTSIMRGNPRSAEQERCLLVVWTNAIGPRRTLDEFQMDDVLAVEAYPSPGVTPPEFAGSPCASIMLWMKQTGS
ncbi:MAG TPA: carboxypeptidase-like regulatory domain-containing protein [Gemmatimonadales bacterium]|nr:carboxypeptidase-like regulatory domain-containing protein [Gemmatimonadales bacterium]